MHYEIWDKVSPVNNIEAEAFMEAHGIRPNDEVYLICRGERTMCVQTNFNSPYAQDGMSIEEMAQVHLEAFEQALSNLENPTN